MFNVIVMYGGKCQHQFILLTFVFLQKLNLVKNVWTAQKPAKFNNKKSDLQIIENVVKRKYPVSLNLQYHILKCALQNFFFWKEMLKCMNHWIGN